MCASTSAIVCGCSSCTNESTWRGSARRRNSNGSSMSEAVSRSRISLALSPPRLSSSSVRAKLEAAGGDRDLGLGHLVELVARPRRRRCRSTVRRRAISDMISSTSVSRMERRTLAERSLPICIRSTAAFWAPVSGAVAGHQALRSASQPRSSAATSSGWRSMSSAISSLTAAVRWATPPARACHRRRRREAGGRPASTAGSPPAPRALRAAWRASACTGPADSTPGTRVAGHAGLAWHCARRGTAPPAR